MTTPRSHKNDERGFTLVEVLVVVIIMGILSAVAVPIYLNQRDKAAVSVTKQNMRNLIPIVMLARENRSEPLSRITSGCSNCNCRNLPNPLPVDHPDFLATPCGQSWRTFAIRLSEATDEPRSSVQRLITDGWGYPLLPDENEGEIFACGVGGDTFVSGGKDHVINVGGDDIAQTFLPTGACQALVSV